MRLPAAVLAAAAALALSLPAAAQTVGSCARGASIQPDTPWVLFDLGSAALRPDAIQVMLPDWIPVSDAEAADALIDEAMRLV